METNRKKQGWVDFEGIQEFYSNTIVETVQQTTSIAEEKKEDFLVELEERLDKADFSYVKAYVVDKEQD
ncbi:hypothetical protein OPHB3_3457 [Oceanobacillus picturae]|uniref:Uncharacterized protein n=1 Tax=Oceanobacillus picturae TaxID=171693 RepID=A0A0U9HBP1_9BACI|nr:hypothetical protein [Oceanobacillus picturae]GAQ19488.1 hypothetical protein OPHB3_3457 [Oceanobacillus picturae]